MVKIELSPKCDVGFCLWCEKKYPFCWVSSKNKFLFFENPKCCSTSLRISLGPMMKKVTNINGKLENYFKFGFVRNPWDRILSLYYHFFINKPYNQKILDHKKRMRKFYFDVDFLEFSDFVDKIQFVHNHHWEKQSVYIPEYVDFVGRFERFSSDINVVLNEIKLPRLKIIHVNKSNVIDRQHYTDMYVQKDIDIVSKMFKEDIDRFGYSFGD